MVEFYRRDAESRLGSVCALQIVSNQVISAYLTKHFTLHGYDGIYRKNVNLGYTI